MYGKGFYTGDPCVRYSNGYYYIMTSETHSDGSLLGGQVRSISCAAPCSAGHVLLIALLLVMPLSHAPSPL